jgi:FtsK/SpoIIIE family
MPKVTKTASKHTIADIVIALVITTFVPWILGKTFKGFRRLAFRWRRVLTPLWFGFAFWIVGLVCHGLVPQWWPVWLALPVVGTTIAVYGPKLSEGWSAAVSKLVPEGLDAGKKGVLDRPIERLYFGGLLAMVGVYLAVRTGAGPSWWTGALWQSGELVFGGSWWWHRRVRTTGRADRYARKWARLSNKETCPDHLKPFVDSKVLSAVGQKRGGIVTLQVRLAGASTADMVGRLTKQLASFYKLRPGAIHVREESSDASVVWFQFMPSDPWKSRIVHPVLAKMIEPGTVSLASLGKQFVMGLYADGRDAVYSLQHTLLVGATGSGKSGWLHSLMMWLTSCSDTVMVGIDMAGGATLGAWKRCLALPLATDFEAAWFVLERVMAVIEQREHDLAAGADDDDDADELPPTPETPWLVLVIDEFPDLLAAAKAAEMLNKLVNLLGRIAKKARKCGVRLVFASQNGTKPDLGSKELQAQLRAVVGMALDPMQSRNLWQTLERLGWNSAHLKQGQYLLRDDEHQVAEPAKGNWVEKKDRRRHVDKAVLLDKTLEDKAWAALCGVNSVLVPVLPAEPEDAVLAYLGQAGPAPAKEVARIVGVNRATAYRRLGRHLEAGLVHKIGDLWHLGADTRAPQDRAGVSVQASADAQVNAPTDVTGTRVM